MRRTILLIAIPTMPILAIAQSVGHADTWKPMRLFEGSWQGKGDDMAGQSDVEQGYECELRAYWIDEASQALMNMGAGTYSVPAHRKAISEPMSPIIKYRDCRGKDRRVTVGIKRPDRKRRTDS